MNQSFNKFTVYGAIAAGFLTFGFAPIFVRYASGTPALVLVTYRTVFAALLLLPYWLKNRDRGRGADAREIPAGEHAEIALAGICLGFHFSCWIASLYYTSVASASTLVAVHPILVILLERLMFKRKFAPSTWAGVGIAFAGSALLGYFDSRLEQSFSDPLFGNFLAFSAALIFVIYLFLGQKIRQKRAWIDYVFPVYSYAAGTCLVLVMAFGENLLEVSATGIWMGLGLALGPQILGHGAMNYAVKYISPTFLSTLVLIEPLIASVLAFVLFSELPPVFSILAMAVILVGVGLTWKRKSGKKRQVNNG